MQLYQYNVYTPETFSASGKAKKDVSQIFKEMDIGDIYMPSRHRIIRILQQSAAVLKHHRDAVIFIQYPAVIDGFIKAMRRKSGVTLVGILHDISCIRGESTPQAEMEVLNCFDWLISHNPSMTGFLRQNGYRGNVVDLGIFDYLHDPQRPTMPVEPGNTVCFAGNLDKSAFLPALGTLSDLCFLLYGVNHLNTVRELPNADYRGMIPSDEIPYQLEGSFGLVWDGERIDGCSGILGNYLRYNNPHKLSLYISAGKPVVVWNKAAVAPFVRQHQIGLTVDSLGDAQQQINSLRPDVYQNMVEHVYSLKQQLAQGHFMKTALQTVIKQLETEQYE